MAPMYDAVGAWCGILADTHSEEQAGRVCAGPYAVVG